MEEVNKHTSDAGETLEEYGTVPDVLDAEEEADAKSISRKRLWIIAAIILILALLVTIYLLWFRTSDAAETADKKDEVVVSVKVAKAEKDTIAREASAVGTVVPSEQSSVSASISAQIRRMDLLKNHLVQKGDVIAILSSGDLEAQRNEARAALDEAKLNLQTLQSVTIPQAGAQSEKDVSDTKAALDNAKATYERRWTLYEKGGISLKELEVSQLAVVNAQNAYTLALKNTGINRNAVNPNSKAIALAKIKQAQDRLAGLDVQANRGEVRAPISGIVTDQFQYEGDFASQGAKLVTISDISSVIVKAQFSDTVVKDVKAGDMVTIYPTSAPDERMTGRVTLISKASDPQSRAVEVWATFGNPQGLLLANGAVQFIVSSKATNDAVVVPSAAVTLNASNGDEGTVMVVGDDSIAHETKVKVGIKQGDKVQILEGLNGGETVVVEGNYALPDGTKVEIAKDEEKEN